MARKREKARGGGRTCHRLIRRYGSSTLPFRTSRKGEIRKGDETMDKAMEAIAEQQAKVKARSAPWMVGEQLKDMIRREPGIAELIAQDLTAGGMSLTKAEDKIKDFADRHRTGTFACVTPAEAEEILREYFGLPVAGAQAPSVSSADSSLPEGAGTGVINLADFF